MHLRVESTLVALIDQALKIGVDFFQCFLTQKTIGRVLPLDKEDVKAFLQLRREHFENVYLHVSYWVNLASVKPNSHYLLRQELRLAKELEFTHVLFHAGSAKGAKRKIEGIDALARMVNRLIKYESEVKIVLENLAQGPPSVGGSFGDFRLLLEKIDKPERLSFCIDTGHAYAYGYDIANVKMQNEFIDLVDKSISLDRVALIHLNNTMEELGSKVDQHERLAEGKISLDALKHFIFNPRLCNIPLLLEPVPMPEEELKKEFDMVVGWQRDFEKAK